MRWAGSLAAVLALVWGTCGTPAMARAAVCDPAWHRHAAEIGTLEAPDRATVEQTIRCLEEHEERGPGDLELRFRLMDALYFLGFFIAEERAEQKALSERAVLMSEETLRDAASPGDRVAAHFWAAVNWGIWASSHGNLASARKNVAARIRDHAQRVIDLDPGYWRGGGYRLLGSLHSEAPRVPGFSGWIDRKQGISLLREACSISMLDVRNPLFLAEALLRHDRSAHAEALTYLEEVAARTPGEERPVEEAFYIRRARELLAEENRRTGRR